MAEAVVSFVLDKCYEWLAPELVQWLHRYEVENKVRSLQEKLDWISASLRDAEKKEGMKTETDKMWLNTIRDIAYDAEDAIDDYIYKAQTNYRKRPFGLFGYRLRVASEKIDDILARLDEAAKNREIFRTPESGEGVSDASPSSIYSSWRVFEEADVVGMDDEASALAMQLLAEAPRRLSVVSIVGMGGLGKTTLAKKVYDHSDVRVHFDCRVWVNVTRDWSGKERKILIEIIKSVASSFREISNWMNVDYLRKELHEILKEKSYLVVLDDVWQKQAWDALAAAFPTRTARSRVLLTTRNMDVALHADDRGFIHVLKFLGEEESWMLFCKKAFPRDDGHTCPSNLESCGRGIVEKCGGLPLAIIVLARLLATKDNRLSEWEKVHKSIYLKLREGESQMKEILELSYYDLPFHLKPCFLYFSAFPDYSMIRASELIKLWVAEGFISERGEESMEDVAEDCLNELVQRSMVQVVEKSSSGGLKTCRLHDLLWDLSLSKSKQDNFLEVYRDIEPTSPTNARRMVIVDLDLGKCVSLNRTSAHLRSLLCFDGVIESKSVHGCFKFLRVLSLYGVDIRSKSIETIGLLIHLRYLGLRNAGLDSLPSTIGNLYNLQTLDVRNNHINSLPDGIWNLKKLRHLRTEYMSIKIPSNVPLDHFSNLQTLATVEPGNWMEDGLAKLRNLSKLKMRGSLSRYYHTFSKANLSQLKSLSLASYDGLFTALSSFSCCRHLYRMSLSGHLEFSDPHQFPSNLRKLILKESNLDQNSLRILEMLPNLHILELNCGSYVEQEMVCSSGGFPRLQVFRLHYLYNLEKLIVNEGAIHDLKELNVLNCSCLRVVLPERLQHLPIIHKSIQFRLRGGSLRSVSSGELDFHGNDDI